MTVAKSGIKFKETSGTEQEPGANPPGNRQGQPEEIWRTVANGDEGKFQNGGDRKELGGQLSPEPVDDKTGSYGPIRHYPQIFTG